MKKIHLLSILTFLSFWCGAVMAQTITISPLPQNITWGDKAFYNNTAYTLVGEQEADSDATSTLKKNIQIDNRAEVQIIIGEQGDAAISEYESLIPSKSEGYYLSITPQKVVIAGKDGNGTFYGVQTFLQIISQPEVMSVTITDYPDVADRGVVEGFYGNPWSHTDRLRQFDFYGQNKMNVYIYGPKDDPYHRARWRENYPTQEAEKLKELVQAAHQNKVQFVWAIHPGNDIQWNHTDSLNIVKKLNVMYNLGVRTFAVFFDDIGGEGTSGIKQAQLMNYINAEFVKKHNDVSPLILCPTQYNRGWTSGDYLTTLGTKMDVDVRIMWTGNSVVDMINKWDMDWINQQISRKAYIWLNYPVNDYCIDHMLMGPTYGNDTNIASQLSGFTSNPMEYAEASKVSLYSIADYTWNMTDYDANASWLRSIKYLMPENEKAFYIFCENNIDLGPTGHGLRRDNESATFAAAANIFNEAMENGYNEEAVEAMTLQFDTLVWAANSLLTSTSEPEMIAEITPWVQVMKYMGQRGQKLMKLYTAMAQDNKELFVQTYLEMTELENAQKNVIARNFEGSIKKPNPTVGDNVINPFLKKHLNALVREYKQKYNYRLDIFPALILEEGRYYIKYNGKYLTNKNANPDKTGDYPVFQSEIDNINPQRQEWTISIDPDTERYKITNAQDSRYINENGSFWADKNINPYDASWHSYLLYRMNGLYAIQNAGSAGSKFWKCNGTRISQGSTDKIMSQNFIFEIIPVGGTASHPTIKESESYYIIYNDLLLTNNNPSGSGGTPTFTKRSALKRDQQLWKFIPVESTGRYKLISAKDERYVNEIGNFGVNAYSDDWNTYILTEMDGQFSIQNAGSGGTNFWGVSDNRMQPDTRKREESYLFKIMTYDDYRTAIDKTWSEEKIGFTKDSSHIYIKNVEKVKKISLLTTDGKTVRSAKNKNSIKISGLPRNLYVLTVELEEGAQNLKVQLP